MSIKLNKNKNTANFITQFALEELDHKQSILFQIKPYLNMISKIRCDDGVNDFLKMLEFEKFEFNSIKNKDSFTLISNEKLNKIERENILLDFEKLEYFEKSILATMDSLELNVEKHLINQDNIETVLKSVKTTDNKLMIEIEDLELRVKHHRQIDKIQIGNKLIDLDSFPVKFKLLDLGMNFIKIENRIH